jgi:DNA-binding CsgD family transcriptional regulator
MEGLCGLVSADAWVWGLAAEMNPDRLPVYVSFQHGRFDEAQFAAFLKIQTHPLMVGISAPYSRELLSHPNLHLTRTLQQIGNDDKRFAEPEVAALWDPCGLHPRCLSFHPLGDDKYSGIALYRKIGRPLFGARESRIAHIIMTEVSWLHAQGWPEDRGAEVPRLSPRTRLVLELLLQSQGRKQIAAHLGISENTVAGYTKEIYRHFRVRSHAELLRRFYQGDGGDRAAPPNSGG